VCAQVTLQQVYEIAKVKQTDYNLSHLSLKALCNMVIGTARSMGVQIVRAPSPK